jgi:alkanesulfonate monooxygenase SsuD/methylene tetrahydromethanopterin reductase-like flavin-dependent oxidoreductase (luciferase family)
VKSRMKMLGRSPEHLKILPGAFVVVGDTVDEAKKKRRRRCSTASFIQTAALHRCRFRSVATLLTLISTVPCRKSPKQMTARAGASASSRSPNATI